MEVVGVILTALITAPVALMIIARIMYAVFVGIEMAAPQLMSIMPTGDEIKAAYMNIGMYIAMLAPWESYQEDEDEEESEEEDSSDDASESDEQNSADVVYETACDYNELVFYGSLMGVDCNYWRSKPAVIINRLVERLNSENIGTFTNKHIENVSNRRSNVIRHASPEGNYNFDIIVDASDRTVYEGDYEDNIRSNIITIQYDLRYDSPRTENALVTLAREIVETRLFAATKYISGGVYYLPKAHLCTNADSKYTEDILESYIRSQVWENQAEPTFEEEMLQYGFTMHHDPRGWYQAGFCDHKYFIVSPGNNTARDTIGEEYLSADGAELWVIIEYDPSRANIRRLVELIEKYNADENAIGCLFMRLPGDEPVKKLAAITTVAH